MTMLHWLVASLLLGACNQSQPNNATEPANSAESPAVSMALSRIDCGRVDAPDFTGLFSDTKAYPAGPRQLASSCYLIRHGDTIMIGTPDSRWISREKDKTWAA